MRRFICLAGVGAAVVAIGAAQAATVPSVSLSVSSFQIRYGDSVRLAGQVSNHNPGVRIGIVARPFSASGFTKLATVTTGAHGRWSYAADPDIATTYQARIGGNVSQTFLVGVRPALSLTEMPNGRLMVHVSPAVAFHGKAVKFQQQRSGAWTTLAKLRLNGASEILVPAKVIPLQKTALRATMSVNQAGSGYLGGFSPPLVLPARWISLSSSATELTYGQAVKLTGTVSTRKAGNSLWLFSRGVAKPEFQYLATVRSGPGGRWSFTARPRFGTVYEAQYGYATTRMLGIGIHPAVKTRIVSNGRVWTHLSAGRSLAGRTVQMQQLSGRKWHTIARQRLDRRSVAIFPASMLPGGSSTLRVAMSVNQAGKGLLGAFGDSFVYQR